MNHRNDEREWRRLLDVYADKADEELLELDARRADLTELAQQALDETLRGRRLEAPEGPRETESAAPRGELAIGQAETLEAGEVDLITFRDGLEATQAIDVLRSADLPHRIAERTTRYVGGDSTVLLDLIVPGDEAQRAKAVLQRALGLFPPPEGDDAPDAEDYAPLGHFTALQAAIVTRALDERAIPHTAEQEDDATEADPVWISIPAERAEEAFALMEQIAGTLPAEDESERS